jgi:hypothetical protein
MQRTITLRKEGIMLEQQLQKVSQHLKDVQAQNEVFIDQGRRAYRAGFEKRNNPLNPPSQRVLWDRGYDLEQKKFSEMLDRWKRQ